MEYCNFVAIFCRLMRKTAIWNNIEQISWKKNIHSTMHKVFSFSASSSRIIYFRVISHFRRPHIVGWRLSLGSLLLSANNVRICWSFSWNRFLKNVALGTSVWNRTCLLFFLLVHNKFLKHYSQQFKLICYNFSLSRYQNGVKWSSTFRKIRRFHS